MNRLEGRLLRAANLSVFCMIRADRIDQTLEAMDLDKTICCTHPRAVLRQLCSVRIQEDGSVNVSQGETRMECLFRHVRNSLAHNHTYMFENGNILLEDCDDSSNISARILIPRDALLDWMKIIKKE